MTSGVIVLVLVALYVGHTLVVWMRVRGGDAPREKDLTLLIRNGRGVGR